MGYLYTLNSLSEGSSKREVIVRFYCLFNMKYDTKFTVDSDILTSEVVHCPVCVYIIAQYLDFSFSQGYMKSLMESGPIITSDGRKSAENRCVYISA